VIEIVTDFDSPDEAILDVSGEVDMNTSDELREILMDAAEQDMEKVTVDLSGVDFMDSSGIATLVDGLQTMKKNGGQLVLRNLNENVRSVFEIANLTDVFTIE